MLNRTRQFWTLQAIGWGGYGGFLLLSAQLWDKYNTVHAAYVVTCTITGLLISLVIHKALRLSWELQPVPRAAITALSVGGATAAWSLLKFYINVQIYPSKEMGSFFVEYLYWYSYSFFILTSW